MRRFLAMALALICLVGVFTGCSGRFDWDKTVNKLEEKGLTVAKDYTTADDRANATAILEAEIKGNGGDFMVVVRKATSFIQDGDYEHYCMMIDFETEAQANSYRELYISTRGEASNFKIAQTGSIIVFTNLDVVQEVIKLEFQ